MKIHLLLHKFFLIIIVIISNSIVYAEQFDNLVVQSKDPVVQIRDDKVNINIPNNASTARLELLGNRAPPFSPVPIWSWGAYFQWRHIHPPGLGIPRLTIGAKSGNNDTPGISIDHADGSILAHNGLYFPDTHGDKISLFGDRLNKPTTYGFGIASGTLQYKSDNRHTWYSDGLPLATLNSTGLGIGTGTVGDLINPNNERLDHELVVQGEDPVVQIRDDGFNNFQSSSRSTARLELLENSAPFSTPPIWKDGAYFEWVHALQSGIGRPGRLIIGTKSNNNDTPRLIIDSSKGNVGIGTSSVDGDHKLSVNGSIRAKEVVVETAWSDFVFANDYRLRPLSEVEQFIDANGHLPDIPSAAAIADEGVRLGEMEARLLQKIEELTLYIIHQQKEIDELKRLNTH